MEIETTTVALVVRHWPVCTSTAVFEYSCVYTSTAVSLGTLSAHVIIQIYRLLTKKIVKINLDSVYTQNLSLNFMVPAIETSINLIELFHAVSRT